jgi:hypothetical protein
MNLWCKRGDWDTDWKHGILNKILAENFPNLGNQMNIQVHKTFKTPNKHTQKRTSLGHIIFKMPRAQNKDSLKIWKKCQVTYKCKPTRIITDISAETQKARRVWTDTFQALKQNNCLLRLLYSAKLPFKIEGELKTLPQ